MKRPKTNRKKIEAELDKVCSQLTIQRDKACVRCGSVKALAAHHCFGRRHMSVRWDLDNLVSLCWPCHKNFAHGDPLGFATWLCDKIGMGAYEKLTIKARSICKRTEFDLLYLLSERKKELT
jgi:hypothetical protein